MPDLDSQMMRLERASRVLESTLVAEDTIVASSAVLFYSIMRPWDPFLSQPPPNGCAVMGDSNTPTPGAAAAFLVVRSDWAPIPTWFSELHSGTVKRSIEILSPPNHHRISHAFQADVIVDIFGISLPDDGDLALVIDGVTVTRTTDWPCRFLLPKLNDGMHDIRVALMESESEHVLILSKAISVVYDTEEKHAGVVSSRRNELVSVLVLCLWKGCASEFSADSYYGEAAPLHFTTRALLLFFPFFSKK